MLLDADLKSHTALHRCEYFSKRAREWNCLELFGMHEKRNFRNGQGAPFFAFCSAGPVVDCIFEEPGAGGQLCDDLPHARAASETKQESMF